MKTQLHLQKHLVSVVLTLGLFLCDTTTTKAQTWIQLGADFTGPTINEFAASVSISADGNTTAFGLPAGGSSTGNRVQVFTYNGTNWTQKGNNILSSSRGGESISLSADGNIICIGAPQSGAGGTNAGLVQVYMFDGTAWQQLGSNIIGGAVGDFFGSKVVISSAGNTIAVAAYLDDINGISDAGSVSVLTYDGTNWIQKGTLIIGIENTRGLGRSLDMDDAGNTVIIGSGTANVSGLSGAGAVLAYSYNGTDWVQKGQAFFGASNEGLGASAAMSSDGNKMAYGAIPTTGTDTGQVKAYNFNGSEWVQLGDVMNTGTTGGRFGNAISISGSGSILAISANENMVSGVQQVGSVIVNQFDGTDWNQVGQIVSGNSIFDQLGSALALSSDGNTYVVAERPAQGTAYVYRINPPLSVNENSLFGLSLFPNPSKGSFTLNLGGQYQNIHLKILNVIGQIVVSKSYSSVERIEDVVIAHPGIYFVNVSSDDSVSQTLRLLIN